MKIESDVREIEDVVNLYLEGLYERKYELLERAFWEESRNIGITADDGFWLKTMSFWKEKCKIPIKQGDNQERKLKIENIDIWHKSAVARVKMEVHHTERIYECVDFLSLLKIEGKWKIINKSWSARNISK